MRGGGELEWPVRSGGHREPPYPDQGGAFETYGIGIRGAEDARLSARAKESRSGRAS
jgi:hypothetical protein